MDGDLKSFIHADFSEKRGGNTSPIWIVKIINIPTYPPPEGRGLVGKKQIKIIQY